MRDLYRLTFVLGDLRGGANLGPKQLEVLLRALVQANVIRLQGSRPSLAHPSFSPWPTGSKPAGHEEWQDGASVLEQRRGNAASLVCLRVAQLQLQGIPARAAVAESGGQWRAALVLPDGSRPELLPPGAGWRSLLDRERITFCLDLFNGAPVSDKATQATLDVLLSALQEIDQNFLLAHPETPPLYSVGEQLLYMEEPTGQEDWQDVPTCLRMLLCDCEDLASWRAAEAVVRQGIPAKAVSSKHTLGGGETLYHITTKFAGGRTEDPSKIQGMR